MIMSLKFRSVHMHILVFIVYYIKNKISFILMELSHHLYDNDDEDDDDVNCQLFHFVKVINNFSTSLR